MKAVRLHAYGDTDQFKYDDIATPVPGTSEVLVKVEASGLNGVELYLRQGYLAQMIPLELPAILGVDLSGTVHSVGSGVTDYKAGDRVIGKLPINGKGSNAEFAIATPAQLARLGANVGFAAGATLPLSGLAGRQAVDVLGVKTGDRVLVTGALGAVGRSAVQYLKQIGAVPVAGVRASRRSEAIATGLEVLAIDEATAKARFDFAVDTVGGPIGAASIALVRAGGKLVAAAGVPEGANADGRINLVSLMTVDNTKMLQDIADAAASGALSIPVARTFKLAEVGEGHKLLAAGQTHGKIVFVP